MRKKKKNQTKGVSQAQYWPSIAPNLKMQRAMEGRRKTSNAKEYKLGPKLPTGLVSFSWRQCVC
jgi:hypothetical protein